MLPQTSGATVSNAWLQGLKQPSDKWLAVRIETFLSHYWQDGDELTGEVVLSDWMAALQGFPRPAVEWACAEWLDTQPRRRPRPGDVSALARDWMARQSERARKETLRGESLTEEQEQVVQWAVDSRRLLRGDAVDAVRQMRAARFPEWILGNDSEAQRCVYLVRHHPNCQEPPEAPKRGREGW